VTGKERVRAAIERRPVDRLPLGFYVVDYDTIERVIGRKTYVRNKIASRIAFWEGRRDEVVESYKKDTVEFYRKIELCDMVCFKEAPIVPPKGYKPEDPPRRVDDRTWEDRCGRIYRISELSNDITCVHDPVARKVDYTRTMFEEEPQVEPPDPSIFEAVDYIIEHLGKDRYIAGTSGGLTALVLLGGMEQGLLMYALEPEVVRAATRHSVRRQNLLDRYFIRPGQDGVLFEQDMAASKGPLLSPAMFREFCFPAMRERVQRVREHGQQVLLHNCGNNRPLMEMFIEAGVQCYQSIQNIPEMEIGGLRRDFGARLSFWGGIALDDLILGTPADVRRNLRRTLARVFSAGPARTGFILGPSHSIAKGTKYENFRALLDEFDRLKDRF